MSTLRKPNVPKIQKLQLMRQYFKDVRSKMLKEEEAIRNQAEISFMFSSNVEATKGVFVKKRLNAGGAATTEAFLFNFKDPSTDNFDQVNSKLDSIKLS